MATMKKVLMAAGLVVLVGSLVAGCAKQVEPEANAPDKGSTTNTTTEPAKTELAPLKQEPSDGDDVAVLETSMGTIVCMFYPDRAPKSVENFETLVKKGFYDGTRFHRCIPGFMIQGGDPNSKDLAKSATWGQGGNTDDMGNEVNVPFEPSDIRHVRGVLSMARGEDKGSASSQFFIMHAVYPSLDGEYSAFGKVVEGLDVVDKIEEATGSQGGTVAPEKAVVLKKAYMAKWPVDVKAGAAN